MKKLLYLIVLSIFTVLISCTPSKKFLIKKNLKDSSGVKYVRVLILKTDKKITIKSKSRLRVIKRKTGKVIFDSRRVKLTFVPEKVKETLTVESWSSPLFINGSPYRGTVEIRNIVGKLYLINVLKVDEYLYSVVPGEIPSSWNMQALKAQAVAARTYAYYHIINNKNSFYDVDSSTKSQVYKGMIKENILTTEAVKSTSGEVISSNFQPILSYFHSTCGGRTIDSKYVWKNSENSYLRSVKCKFCIKSPYYKWTEKLSLSDIRESLKKKYKNIGKIKKISFLKKYGRVINVRILHTFGTIKLTGNNFRLLFPPKKLKSMFFNSKTYRNGLILFGRGWGHGVGLCQWGAKGMAEKGANYKAILKFYYTGIKIVKLNNNSFRYIAAKRSPYISR